MSLGLRDSRAARKRRIRRRVILWLVLFGGLIALGAASYRSGRELARMEVSALQDQVVQLRTSLDESRSQTAQLEVRNRQVAVERDQWRQRYQQEVPTGRDKELFAEVQQQLANGVPPERLSLMIDVAGRQAECDDTPQTKRFIVRTELYQGSEDAVSFGEGAVTVTARGETATDAAGNVEAWYDAAKPVSVNFTALGGRTTKAEGQLPLHHTMIIGKSEYRFAVKAGNRRGFIEVSADRCAVPQ